MILRICSWNVDALIPLIRQNQACCYALLFDAASAPLLEFGRHELDAQLGLTVVLHTWRQTLLDHYRVHCIVTGGDLRADGTWAGTPAHWLFPVRSLSAMFRGQGQSRAPTASSRGPLRVSRRVASPRAAG